MLTQVSDALNLWSIEAPKPKIVLPTTLTKKVATISKNILWIGLGATVAGLVGTLCKEYVIGRCLLFGANVVIASPALGWEAVSGMIMQGIPTLATGSIITLKGTGAVAAQLGSILVFQGAQVTTLGALTVLQIMKTGPIVVASGATPLVRQTAQGLFTSLSGTGHFSYALAQGTETVAIGLQATTQVLNRGVLTQLTGATCITSQLTSGLQHGLQGVTQEMNLLSQGSEVTARGTGLIFLKGARMVHKAAYELYNGGIITANGGRITLQKELLLGMCTTLHGGAILSKHIIINPLFHLSLELHHGAQVTTQGAAFVVNTLAIGLFSGPLKGGYNQLVSLVDGLAVTERGTEAIYQSTRNGAQATLKGSQLLVRTFSQMSFTGLSISSKGGYTTLKILRVGGKLTAVGQCHIARAWTHELLQGLLLTSQGASILSSQLIQGANFSTQSALRLNRELLVGTTIMQQASSSFLTHLYRGGKIVSTGAEGYATYLLSSARATNRGASTVFKELSLGFNVTNRGAKIVATSGSRIAKKYILTPIVNIGTEALKGIVIPVQGLIKTSYDAKYYVWDVAIRQNVIPFSQALQRTAYKAMSAVLKSLDENAQSFRAWMDQLRR